MGDLILGLEKISVIIPVYNVEEYLRQCLDSVVNQTYQDLEIIIIDDGSPDNCGVICDEYATKDPRIKVIHKKNGGLCAARNDGIARATGDWISLIDSDDWCELDYYEQFMRAHKRILDSGIDCNPDVMISKGRLVEYPQKQQPQIWHKEAFHYIDRKQIESLMANIQIYGLPWDKLYSAKFLRENHLHFDTTCKALEDFLFNFQVFDCAKDVIGCTFLGYHNRVVTISSITGGYNPKKFEVTYHTVCVLNDYVRNHNIMGETASVIENVALIAVSHSLNCYYFHPENREPFSLIAKQIKEMKTKSLIHKAIYSKNNRYMSSRQIILKYAMRLPWVWPLKMLQAGKKFLTPH